MSASIKKRARRNRTNLATHEESFYSTPQPFFDKLDAEFHFTLDAAASEVNAKCRKYYTESDNGLLQSWDNEIVWCNPPYNHATSEWVRKALESRNTTSVLLLPASVSSRYFNELVWDPDTHRARTHYLNRPVRICIRFVFPPPAFGDNKRRHPGDLILIIVQTPDTYFLSNFILPHYDLCPPPGDDSDSTDTTDVRKTLVEKHNESIAHRSQSTLSVGPRKPTQRCLPCDLCDSSS